MHALGAIYKEIHPSAIHVDFLCTLILSPIPVYVVIRKAPDLIYSIH